MYDLPWVNDDFVILTPKDILTRDENWINKGDLVGDFQQDTYSAIPDPELRAQVENYFYKILDTASVDAAIRAPKSVRKPLRRTLLEFPQLIDYYIKLKEQHGDEAA